METLPIGAFDYQSDKPPPGQRKRRAGQIKKLTRQARHKVCSEMIGWRKHSTITLDALKAPYATSHHTPLTISTIVTVDQFLLAVPMVCKRNQLQKLKALFSHAQNHFANDHMPSAMFYRDEFGHTPIHLMALFCPLPSIKALFQWMQDAAPAIIFNAHIENCYGLTAYDIANQRFNPTSDDEKDIVLTFAKWAQTNESVHTVPNGASFSDIQVLRDAKAKKNSAGARRSVAVPMTRGVIVPLANKRKRGDTVTPSHILKVTQAKRSRRLLQDQWRIDPLVLTYLTNALEGKSSSPISLKSSIKHKIKTIVKISQSLPSSLKDSLTQENIYMALDHLLNEKPSTCTKHLPPVVRVIIDIVQYKNNKGPISLDSRCPLLDVDDSQQPAIATIYHTFGFMVLVDNTTHHLTWGAPDDKKTVAVMTYQADWETLPEPHFTGRSVDFLQKTIVHSSPMDSTTPVQPKLKKVLGFQSNVLAHILCPFRELRAPEFTQPIQTLIQLMLHFDDFNEKLGVHPAVTRTHYDYLHALLFNLPTLETNFSDYSLKDDPYYRLFQKTVADIDRAFEIKKVKKSLRHHWKDWLFNHFKSTIAEREFKEQLKYTRASNERLLDTYFKIRLDTIGIGALFALILSYSGIDTKTPEIEQMIIALCLLNGTSNDLLSGLKEYYDAINATVPSDEFASLWTEDFLDLTMADIKKRTKKYPPTFEANAPYLFTRAIPKATIRDGFVSTSLLHHRLLEQLQAMLQDFKPEKFNMAQRHALLGIIDATIGRATTGTSSKTPPPNDIIHCTAASKMRYTDEAQFSTATG